MTATPAGGRHGRPWRAAGAAVVVLLAMVGAFMIGASTRTVPPPRPPQPLAQAGPADRSPAPDDDPGGEQTGDVAQAPEDPDGTDPGAADPGPDAGAVDGTPAPVTPDPTVTGPAALTRSTPTTISIPRIGVNASIISLGTNPDGTVQVPPLEQAMTAGWYSPGASPGEVGNAVVVGHVDSAKIGPAVFFNLGALQPGDTITVGRQDGRSVTFTVDEVRSYPKTAFPTEQVYGPNDRAGLRVVTCGGTFDETARSYLDNVVVYATMTG
ncbi:class F sortase [Micromonospora siamensis]